MVELMIESLLRASRIISGKLPKGRIVRLAIRHYSKVLGTFDNLTEALNFIKDKCKGEINIGAEFGNEFGIICIDETNGLFVVYYIVKDSVAFEHEKPVNIDVVKRAIKEIILNEALKSKPKEIQVPREEESEIEKVLGEHAEDVRKRLLEAFKVNRFVEYPIPYRKKYNPYVSYSASYAHVALLQRLGITLRIASCKNTNFAIVNGDVCISSGEYNVTLQIPGTEVLTKAKYKMYVEAMRRIREAIDRIVNEIEVKEEPIDVMAKLEEYARRIAELWAERIVEERLVTALAAAVETVKKLWTNRGFVMLAAQGWDANDLRIEVKPRAGDYAYVEAIAPNARGAAIEVKYRDIPLDKYVQYARMLVEKIEQHERTDVGPAILVNIKYCKCPYKN